jgi:hypothetical protein
MRGRRDLLDRLRRKTNLSAQPEAQSFSHVAGFSDHGAGLTGIPPNMQLHPQLGMFLNMHYADKKIPEPSEAAVAAALNLQSLEDRAFRASARSSQTQMGYSTTAAVYAELQAQQSAADLRALAGFLPPHLSLLNSYVQPSQYQGTQLGYYYSHLGQHIIPPMASDSDRTRCMLPGALWNEYASGSVPDLQWLIDSKLASSEGVHRQLSQELNLDGLAAASSQPHMLAGSMSSKRGSSQQKESIHETPRSTDEEMSTGRSKESNAERGSGSVCKENLEGSVNGEESDALDDDSIDDNESAEPNVSALSILKNLQKTYSKFAATDGEAVSKDPAIVSRNCSSSSLGKRKQEGESVDSPLYKALSSTRTSTPTIQQPNCSADVETLTEEDAIREYFRYYDKELDESTCTIVLFALRRNPLKDLNDLHAAIVDIMNSNKAVASEVFSFIEREYEEVGESANTAVSVSGLLQNLLSSQKSQKGGMTLKDGDPQKGGSGDDGDLHLLRAFVMVIVIRLRLLIDMATNTPISRPRLVDGNTIGNILLSDKKKRPTTAVRQINYFKQGIFVLDDSDSVAKMLVGHLRSRNSKEGTSHNLGLEYAKNPRELRNAVLFHSAIVSCCEVWWVFLKLYLL